MTTKRSNRIQVVSARIVLVFSVLTFRGLENEKKTFAAWKNHKSGADAINISGLLNPKKLGNFKN